LALCAVIPVAVIALVGAVLLAISERRPVQGSLETTALAFAVGFEREIGEIIGELDAMVSSSSLAQGESKGLHPFYQKVEKIQSERESWAAVVLVDALGTTIFDTTLPFGDPVPNRVTPPVREALQTGKPAVSTTLMKDARTGEEILPIAVPIFQDGQIRFAICVKYRASALSKVFGERPIPRRLMVAVFDREGMLLAHPAGTTQRIGERVSPGLLQVVSEEGRAALWERAQDGAESFAVVSPVPRTHWSIVLAMPADEYWRPVWRAAVLAGGAGTTAVVLSALIAVGFGRRISRSISAAARASATIPRGEPFPPHAPSGIVEVRELFAALKETAALISRRSTERDAAIAEMQDDARRRDALARIYLLGWDEPDLDVLLTKISEQLGGFLGAEACVIFRVEGRSLHVQAATGWPAACGRVVPVTASLDGVLNTSQIIPHVVTLSGAASDDFQGVLSADGFRSAVLMRIKELNVPYGLLAWVFTQDYTLSAANHFFVQAAAVVVGKRISELNARRLAQTNAQLAAAIDCMDAGVTITDVSGPDSRVVFVNPGFTKVTGYSREEMIGRPYPLAGGADLTGGDTQRLVAAIAAGRPETMTICAHRKDGKLSWNEIHLSFISDEAGKPKFVISVQTDVTARVEVEERLRQTMKMEGLGQLTGGVAHDFNNILTVITGTIGILADGVADRPPLAAIAKMIGEAAERGGELTRRLLAFARKQPLQPRETDVNALIVDTVNMLQPSLGAKIEIVLALAPHTWPALVDPSQLTTALVNLALNARDAMPAGGRLTLETGNVELDASGVDATEFTPGSYVAIAVTDTGTGIPLAIRDRVLEPFFTTKDERKGTGLGLSMVYGFVTQSGGHLKVYSEEGCGTSVKIFLPRADRPADTTTECPAAAPMTGGRETILVVEDDELVRANVIAQLHSLGYATVEAGNAADAIDLVRDGAQFDLLFTDVIMPGRMDGAGLARQVSRLRPGVKVLFTSGYAENAIIHHGRLDPGLLLLPKPYRRDDLARMIRTAIDGPRPSVTAADGLERSPPASAGSARRLHPPR
jgi:PAS domain S-box-containing protein